MKNTGKVMGLREAAKYCGLRGAGGFRRLKRMLLRRERELDREIMVRVGNDEEPRYRVSTGALRRYLPQLFDGNQKLQSEFLRFRKDLGDEFTEMRDRIEVLEHKVAALASQLVTISDHK